MLIFQRAVRYVLLLFIFSLPLSECVAWSRTGHMVIAAMAYRTLPAELQESYTELLTHHPDYAAWKSDYDKLEVDIELGEYLFMQASFWPDVIRRAGSIYDYPTWHYTNLPLRPGVFSGEITEIESTLTPENDVVFGFNESVRTVQNSSLPMEQRAAHLSWILHLVGDVHQPLHTVALVSEIYPEGDRGGNLFFVRPTEESRGVNLHAFWDSLLGRSDQVRNARNETTRLLHGTEASYRPPEGDTTRIGDWTLEGRALAIEYVYVRGTVGSALEENKEQAPLLPSDYARIAKGVAEQQAIKAGIRLARILGEH